MISVTPTPLEVESKRKSRFNLVKTRARTRHHGGLHDYTSNMHDAMPRHSQQEMSISDTTSYVIHITKLLQN